MARKVTKLISEDELRQKLEKIGIPQNGFYGLPDSIKKDLSKVIFDFENTECSQGGGYCGCNDMVGFHTLPNGLAYLGVTAGGDWECPIYFILYYSGKEIRGYIPEDGNIYNKETKTAYGSEMEAFDRKNYTREKWEELQEKFEDGSDNAPSKCDSAKMTQDIMSRIEVPGTKQTTTTAVVDSVHKRLFKLVKEWVLAKKKFEANTGSLTMGSRYVDASLALEQFTALMLGSSQDIFVCAAKNWYRWQLMREHVAELSKFGSPVINRTVDLIVVQMDEATNELEFVFNQTTEDE